MANLAYDSNKSDQQDTTTDVLNPQYNQQGTSENTNVESGGGQPAPYVSNGNPYGSYDSSASQPTTSQSSRQSGSVPSSGQHTNVQSYVDKNKQSSQQMGQAVEGKLQTTADQVQKNTQNVNKQFQQGMDVGSVENWQNAGDEAKQAFGNAASQTAPSKNWVDNSAQMYTPEAVQNETGSPQYSEEDQSLVDSNMARVLFGDGTSKDFNTQMDATNAIDEWNKQNPGYNQYGNQQDLGVTDQRLSDILNAKYSGPTDLFQTRGYSDLSNNVANAQALQNQALSNDFKGELLKQTFGSPNAQYSLGNQRLDDLLLGQGDVGASLKEKAQTLGQGESGLLSDDFQSNIINQRQAALERSGAMDELRKSSRSALDETALGRESEIDQRMNSIVENWDQYPQYFKDRLTQEMTKHESGADKKKELDTVNQQVQALQSRIAENERIVNNRSKFSSGLSDSYYRNKINQFQQQLSPLLEQQTSLQEYSNFNPANMNLGLSEIEAEMLGVKGGEGLYNILNQEGGIENLIKTSQADRNKLISQDEQSQLARLQQIAGLANDYGSADSGINFNNQYVNREAAGTQSALDALDMENFNRVMRGAEKDFRNYADAANITGVGKGKATSGGALGTKKKTTTEYMTENLGNLLENADGYRNMYEDQGVNQNNLDQILGLAKGVGSGSYEGMDINTGINALNLGNASIDGVDFTNATNAALPGAGLALGGTELYGNQLTKLGEGYSNLMRDIAGNSVVGDVLSTPGKIYGEIGKGVSNLASGVSSALFGSDKGLKEKAKAKAKAAATKDLKNKIDTTLANQGYGNQLSVQQNANQDLELLKLLGLMDTTNK